MNTETSNAIAGPSNIRTSPHPSSPVTPHLFLPPPAPLQTSSACLSSTQDLLARFDLLSPYDKYVRPFAPQVGQELDQSVSAPTPGALDKGKGKEVVDTPEAGLPDGGDGDDDEGAGAKGDKKKKNNYKHLIKGVPGKHSFRKDEYLWTMMQIPPKQRIPIQSFDARTQREAFSVSLEGLKGWNPSALVLESPQAREDRKKRKELKRLQKLQTQSQAPGTQPTPIQTSLSTPTTTAPSLARVPPISASSPKIQSNTASLAPPLASPIPSVRRTTSAVPRPGSTVPIPGSTKPSTTTVGRVATPSKADSTITPRIVGPATPTVATHSFHATDADNKRGIKRERDEIGGAAPVNGIGAMTVNGSLSTSQPKSTPNTKAGVRPRPIKRQKMDVPGQARDMTMIQQPTPQGV